MWLFLIFVAVPIIEIALFINLGGWLGTFPTLAIIVITAALGTFLVKTQAISAFKTIGTKFRSLQNPTEPVAHAAMILFAGALLLTPGFFTDAVGFSFLMPWFRTCIFKFVKRKIEFQNVNSKDFNDNTRHGYNKKSHGDIIIEGEYRENKATPPKDILK
ncbi:FxsA family protein [Paracoccaceae bacterium]|jgi:UPF0716 protein FxsA|nr:FxsA family protein [Paracoccaceae bacterium]